MSLKINEGILFHVKREFGVHSWSTLGDVIKKIAMII